MLISAQSFLQMIGASASFSDGGWRVSIVANASIADAAGLKNGDVITAIGSRRLGAQTLLDGTQIEQRLEVRRDGKTVVLRLNRR
jgi:C-terminal processing protease CtpA/Prc